MAKESHGGGAILTQGRQVDRSQLLGFRWAKISLVQTHVRCVEPVVNVPRKAGEEDRCYNPQLLEEHGRARLIR